MTAATSPLFDLILRSSMTNTRSVPTLAALALLAAPAPAQDISVSLIGFGNDYEFYGTFNGIAAYSMATTACNVGDVLVSWRDHLKDAPIIGTNLFRVFDGRIEQLGYSFVKYSFCAFDAQGGGCPNNCQNTFDCNWLGLACADTYSAEMNDGKKGGAKWEINPTTGEWPSGNPTPPKGNKVIRGRIQVDVTEIANPEDIYIAEAQYLSGHDQLAGNGRDNYAWRTVDVPIVSVITNNGPTNMGDPAIFAWQALNNDVLITEVALEDEGGVGIHGWYFVGSRAIDLGGGLWRYEYAVQNGNSQRAARSFSVRLPCDGSLALSDFSFHDIRHHSGSPYSNGDWKLNQTAEWVGWRTVKNHAQNPDANALRWGTLYNFGFTANRAPAPGKAEIGLFVPGTPDSLAADVIAPGGEFQLYCPVNPNSTGNPALLSAVGSPHVDDEAVTFAVSDLPQASTGYFAMSKSQGFVPFVGGGDGNLCLGSPLYRFAQDVLDSGLAGFVQFSLDFDDLPGNQVFLPGDTWNFQYWYRDLNPNPTSNTTGGVTVVFCQ